VGSRDQAGRLSPDRAQARRYHRICEAAAAIGAASAVIDGEAVCCDDVGVAVFERLHSRAYDAEVFLYAFDILTHGRAQDRNMRFRVSLSGGSLFLEIILLAHP
jgi:hypothetical protein